MARQGILTARRRGVGPHTIGLGVVAAGLVVGTLADLPLPLVSGDRAALIALAVVGLTMCAVGPLGELTSTGAWTKPSSVAGILLGGLALAVVAAGLGLVALPLLSGPRSALVALAAVMAAKLIVGGRHRRLAGGASQQRAAPRGASAIG